MPTVEELRAMRDRLQQQLDSVNAEIETTRAHLTGVLAETETRKQYKAELEEKIRALEAEIQALQG